MSKMNKKLIISSVALLSALVFISGSFQLVHAMDEEPKEDFEWLCNEAGGTLDVWVEDDMVSCSYQDGESIFCDITDTGIRMDNCRVISIDIVFKGKGVGKGGINKKAIVTSPQTPEAKKKLDMFKQRLQSRSKNRPLLKK